MHAYLSGLYQWAERPAQSLAEARRAKELDPLSVLASLDLSGALYNNGRFDEALAELGNLRDVNPPLARASLYTGIVYLSKRMWPEAIRTLDGWGAWNVRALAVAGRRTEARRRLGDALAHGSTFDRAILYEGLGQYDSAFAYLERSFDDHSLRSSIMWPTFARFRADPRFDRIRQRLNGGSVPGPRR